MSGEIDLASLWAPEGGWRVRVIDLSGGNAEAENVVEEIKGFPTLMEANAFARAYVRDSVERCRQPGMSPAEVASAWFAFGEDAEVADAGEQGWRSAAELDRFAAMPAGVIERDWRAIDPRRDGAGEGDEDA